MNQETNAGSREQPIKTRRMWLTALFLSASAMMIETSAYRQWQVFLRKDALPFMLPLVMAGLAAGAIAFYFFKRKSSESISTSARPDFILRPLFAYAITAPAPFLLLPLCTSAQPSAALLLEAISIVSCFFLFAAWGYINSALFDRCHSSIFQLYAACLLGTIVGAIAAIVLMDACGTPCAISFSLATAVLTVWVWIIMNPSPRRSARYTGTFLAFFAIAAVLVLPPKSFIVFHQKKTPVWVDSNSYSQLEMHPVTSLDVLRAPGIGAINPDESNVEAWRVYFDGLDFNFTNLVSYRTLDEVRFMSRDLSNLAFLAGNRERALILGAGGGVEVIQGLLAGYREIDAVDINPLVVKAIYKAHASNFMNAVGVRYHIADARRFLLNNRQKKYDLIFMPHVRGQGVAGVVTAKYMITAELIDRSLDKVAPGGTLVIRNHRLDWPSSFGTIKAVLKNRPLSENWSVFVASESSKKRAYSLVLLRSGLLTAEQSREISKFIDQSGFTWMQIDLSRMQDNSLVLTEDHPYATNFQHVLSGQGLSMPTRNIVNSGATVPVLVRFAAPLSVAFATILSLMILQSRASHAGVRPVLLAGSLYFSALGSGFLATEIVLIEQTYFVSGNPTAAFGITVCSLLSGALLSIWLFRNADSPRLTALLPKTGIAAAFVIVLAFFALGKLAFVPVIPDWLRLLLAGFAITAAGAPMGLLFPGGLRLLAEAEQNSIPWNWAINGVASVIGGTGVQLLALIFGYRTALGFAVGCYVLAAIASLRVAGLLNRLKAFSAP